MIKKYLIPIATIISILTQCSCSGAVDLPEAQITVRVINEEEKSVENAQVKIGFEVLKKPYIAKVEGSTNTDGILSVSSKSLESIAIEVEKQGYYKTKSGYRFKTMLKGKWQPWNPEIQVILRKIINPVGMYARDTQMSGMTIPETGKEIGFDLTEYDWVRPYGKGKNNDFVFKLNRMFKSENDFDSELILTFSDKFDGIQNTTNPFNGSLFKLKRFAPEEGYRHKLTFTKSKHPDTPIQESCNNDNNIFFRIRSEEKDGKLKRAMYGKIHGDICFDPRKSKTATIQFKYYLNPDYTQNLEFDPKRNLFYDLQGSEQIGL